jgi:phage-related tail fiber protein
MADTPKLQGIWTQYGLDKLTSLLSDGGRLVIAFAALGDGKGYLPIVQPSQAALVREVWRGPVNRVAVNPDDSTDVIVDAFVPGDVGGFFVREWGLFDDTNRLIAVGPHDEMHKPLIAEGQAAEFLERFHLPVSNTAVIKLTLATQAMASVDYVDDEIARHDAAQDAHQGVLVAFAWKLAGVDLADLIISKASGDDWLDVSSGYQGLAVLPAKTTFTMNASRELILRLPA